MQCLGILLRAGFCWGTIVREWLSGLRTMLLYGRLLGLLLIYDYPSARTYGWIGDILYNWAEQCALPAMQPHGHACAVNPGVLKHLYTVQYARFFQVYYKHSWYIMYECDWSNLWPYSTSLTVCFWNCFTFSLFDTQRIGVFVTSYLVWSVKHEYYTISFL